MYVVTLRRVSFFDFLILFLRSCAIAGACVIECVTVIRPCCFFLFFFFEESIYMSTLILSLFKTFRNYWPTQYLRYTVCVGVFITNLST